MNTKKPDTIDEYIDTYPKDIQKLLKQVKTAIKKAAPGAEEVISYSMPAFKLNGLLVWFAAHTHHIGFYPKASGIEHFKKEITKYKSSKGAVQFPVNEPLPIALITEMVKFRANENLQKLKKKKSKPCL
ncbi:MAG: DUF1801 domain-containing protein [Bacteroidota bacterium]